MATPIGNVRDITLRALDILASADVLAAEDTRSLRKLMGLHGIALADRPMIAYHDHNRSVAEPRLLGLLETGASIAYASEAGTPLISDPGFGLARDAAEQKFLVTAAPGASAVITALTLSGLPTDAFTFAGFLPTSAEQKRTRLADLGSAPGSLVFYESPKRIAATLTTLSEVFGPDIEVSLCRELTKKFEDIRRGPVAQVLHSVTDDPPRGEIVLVIGPRPETEDLDDVRDMLAKLLVTQKVKDAAKMVSAKYNVSQREVYQMALEIKSGSGSS